MEELAKKCILDHRHPIVKITLPPQKLFLPATNDEKDIIEEQQNKFSTILGYTRVEKRSSRAKAIWLADKGVGKVTKIIKNLVKYFGYQNKEGLFLYPEEMLYLLETNRLEVTFDDISITIEQAFDIMLKIPDVNLTKYNVYKKLALLGYKLVCFHQIASKTSHRIKKIELKRSLEESENCKSHLKKIKKCDSTKIDENKSEIKQFHELYSDDPPTETSMPKEAEYISKIFDHLRENMPKAYGNEVHSINPDYCVFSPANNLKTEPDFNLFICRNNITDRKNFNSQTPCIFAINIDDVSFYKFNNVHLPFI